MTENSKLYDVKKKKKPLEEVKKPIGVKLYTLDSKSSSTAVKTPDVATARKSLIPKSSKQLGQDRADVTKQVMDREFSRGKERDSSQDINMSDVDLSFFKDEKARKTIRSLMELRNKSLNYKRSNKLASLGIERQKIGAGLVGNPGVVQDELNNRTMGNLLNRGAQDYESNLKYGPLDGQGGKTSNLDTMTSEVDTTSKSDTNKESERIAKDPNRRQIRPSLKRKVKRGYTGVKKAFKDYTIPGNIYKSSKKALDYIAPKGGRE